MRTSTTGPRRTPHRPHSLARGHGDELDQANNLAIANQVRDIGVAVETHPALSAGQGLTLDRFARRFRPK